MAKLKEFRFHWDESPSLDVTYRIRVEPSDMEITYDSPYVDVGDVNSVNLADYDIFKNLSGMYNVSVSSVDGFGNESNFAIKTGEIDFKAPLPPTNPRFVFF